jgi:DNA-binding FadR family transcriptional regulator
MVSESTENALLRPVRHGNAFEDTMQRLLQTIRLGIAGPGESLPSERELALRFGVSRDTVRDAIRALADAGFVESRRGRYGGTFVLGSVPTGRQPVEPDAVAPDLADVLAVREILEVGAARVAARRTLAAAERDLLFRRLQEVDDAGVEDYRRLDSRLHLTIGELCGSPTLLPLLADSRTQVNQLLDDIPLLPRNLTHSNEQHHQIVLAILSGDPERAAAATEEHLAGTAALLHGFLD